MLCGNKKQKLTCSSCGCPTRPLRWDIWACCKGAGRFHSRRGRVSHHAGWSGSGSPCSPLRWQCNTLRERGEQNEEKLNSKSGLQSEVRRLIRQKSKACWELLKRHVKSCICDLFNRESGFSETLACLLKCFNEFGMIIVAFGIIVLSARAQFILSSGQKCLINHSTASIDVDIWAQKEMPHRHTAKANMAWISRKCMTTIWSSQNESGREWERERDVFPRQNNGRWEASLPRKREFK